VITVLQQEHSDKHENSKQREASNHLDSIVPMEGDMDLSFDFSWETPNFIEAQVLELDLDVVGR
jgi:hypothetical protein